MIIPNVIHAKHIMVNGFRANTIAHSDKLHQATSPPPSLSQDSHLQYSSQNAPTPPTRMRVEEVARQEKVELNQEKSSSPPKYAAQAQVSLPLTLNVVVSLKVETSPQTTLSPCSIEQND